ncbi:MAG: Nramp family divalent metal transporter, partial [Gammaproteobacteria bacterium]
METTTKERHAPEVSSKNLPPMPYKDIPEPGSLRRVLGPSIILAALAVSSGEYILWPYITSEVGFALLWLAFVGVTLQYVLNMEIERWTLATGETAIIGFARMWKPWGLVMVAAAFITLIWPGWATSGATVLGFIFGLSESGATWLAIIAIVAIAVTLTTSPVVYNTLEKLETLKVIAVFVFLLVALVTAISAEAWANTGQIVTNIGNGLGTLPGDLNAATVLGALAFAGAGALANLAQSNWIRDKGFGMGAHIPRVVSPVTGEDVAAPATGSMVRQDEENLNRFRRWWRVANIEQLVSFWALTTLSIFVLCMIAYSTVYGRNIPGEGDLDFIQGMGDALKNSVGSWFGTLFWAIGGAGLLLTALANVDYPCRFAADVLKTAYMGENQRWSESRIYFVAVLSMCAVGVLILLLGLTQPLVLLVISSA